ncbi:hypothetical protein [Amycolatopsis sp. CA-126428]|uniref:hypothetical protein n=1 Tax=Amycolatopsis sp. CA-126428 TaxID=2073158 RepID=UPI001304C142|nr:hypothetical protein [Amycolatopsis sp. CA-126428]
MLVQAGETFPMDSMEAYRSSAQRWLKDNSNLSTRTIEQADWQEVYETLKV